MTKLQPIEPVGQIDPERIRGHVQSLVAHGPRSVDDAAARAATIAYLKEQLTDYGYEPRLEPFDTEPHDLNVLAELRGSDSPREIVELGAHYDTVRGSPGADDNASGVAGLLEIARVLSGIPRRRTIRFCLFGGEESGLRGSRAHVTHFADNSLERVLGIVVFEMIGYRTKEPGSQRTPIRIPFIVSPPRVGNFITIVSNFASRSIAKRFEMAARSYVPELNVFAVKRLGGFFKDAARSDHVPYWRNGHRGIMVTDTANFRNPHYHKPTDTPESLDYTFVSEVAQATGAMLLEWSNSEK